jgi:hypothetical protein
MKPISAFKTAFLMSCMLCALACSEPPVPAGSPTSAGSSAGKPLSAQGGAAGSAGATLVVGGNEDAAPQPEFRATRGAIQGVTEFSPEAGKKLETACAAAEDAVAKGSGARADDQLHAMLTLLGSAQTEGLPGLQASAVYVGLAKDLGTLKPGPGTPKVVITETVDMLCDSDGVCAVDSPGALCHTAAFPGLKPLCGCAEPAPPSVAVEEAGVPGEGAPEGDSEAAEPAPTPEDEEATKK